MDTPIKTEIREGEVALPFDPAVEPADAHLVFIGRIHSPWTRREECPKNTAAAREAARPASAEIAPPYRQGLTGLAGFSHVALLTWLDRAGRNLIVQKPRHALEARGVFALRSPLRPNPVGLHVVRLLDVNVETGILSLEGIDVLDGTPLIDVKPYFASVDAVPNAERPEK